ncbi:MAG: DUF1616 domain-containing protein [Thermoplasmatota archaeon]
MRVEIRKIPYDLYIVIAVSTLLLVVIAVNELSGLEMQALRVVLGLPFILFFPGYVLISALYPEKKRYFDRNGEPTDPPSDDEPEEEEKEIKGKGLDGLERVALSLGLSIAITPLIGLVLNWTYEWDPEHLGIRLVPILASQYLFILVCGIVAVKRRLGAPEEDRFSIVMDLTFPKEHTTMDKVLTMGIVLMMVLSVGMLIYIIVVPREGESFTEFYVLGPGGMADDYPRNIYLEEEKLVYIGVGNHEHRDMNYTLVMSIDDGAMNTTVESYDHVTLSRSRQPSMPLRVQDGATEEIGVNFSVLEVGSFKLRLLLFLDGEEYRDLHLWIKVFQEEHLVRSRDAEIEFYLAGPGGDPSLLATMLQDDVPAHLTVGLRNAGADIMDLNLTISTGAATEWQELQVPPVPVKISSGSGGFMEVAVNSTSSVGPIDVLLDLEPGEHVLRFRLLNIDETLTISHSVEVA